MKQDSYNTGVFGVIRFKEKIFGDALFNRSTATYQLLEKASWKELERALLFFFKEKILLNQILY